MARGTKSEIRPGVWRLRVFVGPDPATGERTYSRWLEEGAAPLTVRHCHRILAGALKQGQRCGLVTRCATDLARPPALQRPSPAGSAGSPWTPARSHCLPATTAERWADEARVELAPDGYILTLDPTGVTPLKPDTITAGFTRATRRVGARLRFHDLRHMSASLLVGAGTDVRTVAGRLRHADASVTLRIYAHEFEVRDRQAAEVLGALLPG